MWTKGESEGLQTLGIVVVVCSSLKLLHYLGLIDLSDDKIEDELEMTTVCHRPEGLEQLEAQTNFTKRELQVLYRGFKNECPSGVVNEETFKQIYAQFFPHGDASMYAHYLFNAFDTAQNGSVKFEDFVMALSILLRGTVHEKLRWTFNLYDINKDGYINKEEMMDIVKAIYDMMGKYTYPVLKEDAPRQHVEVFFQKMDKNKDGVVTLDEFIESCQESDSSSVPEQWEDAHYGGLGSLPAVSVLSLALATSRLLLSQELQAAKSLLADHNARDDNIMRSLQLFENVM